MHRRKATEAEIGGIGLQARSAKEGQPPPEPGRKQGNAHISESQLALWRLEYGLLPLELGENKFLLSPAAPSVVLRYSSYRKLVHLQPSERRCPGLLEPPLPSQCPRTCPAP